jgi:hypothetical protein
LVRNFRVDILLYQILGNGRDMGVEKNSTLPVFESRWRIAYLGLKARSDKFFHRLAVILSS